MISFTRHRPLLFAALLLSLASCTAISPPEAVLPSRDGIVPGEQITVKGAQNIYGVARQYNVSMRDLIVLNNIQPPFLVRQGQRLTLPAAGGVQGTGGGSMAMPPPDASAVPAVQTQSLEPVQASSLPPLAQQPLSRSASVASSAPLPAAKPSHAAPSAEILSTPSPVRAVPNTVTKSPVNVVAAAPLAHSSQESQPVSFVWPVQGPVLSNYGSKGQGLSNDGVNIGAPKGAPIVAAANGIVVYAGNDMRGFGNLVLIRHQGGWVTAYAHLDRTLVNKDAVVAQGDMIGTVGKTGNVSAPQLHFETRFQGKAVDPNGVVKS